MCDDSKLYTLNDHHLEWPINLPKLKPGMVVSMYMDTGPSGMCGQSMSITCPWQEMHIFANESEFREHGESHRNGTKKLFAYTVIGDYGTGTMRIIDHTQNDGTR